MKKIQLDFNEPINMTEEFKENEIDRSDDYIIDTIVPFSMNILDNPNNPDTKIASLFFIAKSKSDYTFSIYTSHLLENDDEVESIKNIYPFHIDNNFSSFRIASNMIINSYKVYSTDFNFEYNKDAEFYKFSIKAIRQDSKGLHETVQFNMISDVFAGLKYIDTYAYDLTLNNYELSIASLSAKDSTPDIVPTEMINANKLDRVVAMAPIGKDSTTYGIEFVALDDNDNKYTILSTFNLGQKFNKKKYKGMDINKIQNNYLKEEDQYLQLFATYCRFNNIDKEFLIIKAKNKDGKHILLMLDSTVRIELQTLIGEY